MQAKSNGLLEVTVLISGDSRKRNVPGAAFARVKKKLIASTKNIVASVNSSTSSPIVTLLTGRPPNGRETPCKSYHSGDGAVVSGRAFVSPTIEPGGLQEAKTAQGGEDQTGRNCIPPL
ncbi:unnamed protein product, partial [Laminaria digitata]